MIALAIERGTVIDVVRIHDRTSSACRQVMEPTAIS
jgi:hypothetical protein